VDTAGWCNADDSRGGRVPAKSPVTANVRFTQNTRPISLGQGVWEFIRRSPWRRVAGAASAHVPDWDSSDLRYQNLDSHWARDSL